MKKIQLSLFFVVIMFITNCTNVTVKIPFLNNVKGYVTSINDRIVIGSTNGEIIKKGVNIDGTPLGITFYENTYYLLNLDIGDYIIVKKEEKSIFISRINGEEIIFYFKTEEFKELEKSTILTQRVR